MMLCDHDADYVAVAVVGQQIARGDDIVKFCMCTVELLNSHAMCGLLCKKWQYGSWIHFLFNISFLTVKQ